MVNQTYKIHTFLSVLTDCVFGFTISLTFGSDEFDIIYKNLFPTSQYIYQPFNAVLRNRHCLLPE